LKPWVHKCHKRFVATLKELRSAQHPRHSLFKWLRRPDSNLHGTCATVEQALTAGIPPCPTSPATGRGSRVDDSLAEHEGRGSIIVIVATDAPLLPHQLERIAKRVMLGMGRLGSFAGNSSGDLFLAFSTANANAAKPEGTPVAGHAAQ
jgi:L-aminopeptidase/D-esterase-like protein